ASNTVNGNSPTSSSPTTPGNSYSPSYNSDDYDLQPGLTSGPKP
ncbi:MAG TPA: cell wall-binding protein, partial [Candidatus Ventrimonas merdavium]|nr:cell wall-binding protein [Candidatus Ventrimonas merdavium]